MVVELFITIATTGSETTIEDYAEQSAALRSLFEGVNGKPPGDPTKLAAALIKLASPK